MNLIFDLINGNMHIQSIIKHIALQGHSTQILQKSHLLVSRLKVKLHFLCHKPHKTVTCRIALRTASAYISLTGLATHSMVTIRLSWTTSTAPNARITYKANIILSVLCSANFKYDILMKKYTRSCNRTDLSSELFLSCLH